MYEFCKSCGIEWINHKGTEPTCKELQEANTRISLLEPELHTTRKELEDLRLKFERSQKENYRLGCLVSELRADTDLYRATFGKEES